MRPELNGRRADGSTYPCPDDATALYMIRDAVQSHTGLIAGKLHYQGESCAIGAFWDNNPKLSLRTKLIDEVAMYNDSIKDVSPAQRRRKVLAWLNWRIKTLAGMKASPPS